jgi:hypothetical protein
MLFDIHKSIENLLYTKGQINPAEVDVRFEIPAQDWIESLIKPTINMFLFDIEENTDLRQGGRYQGTSGSRNATTRLPARRFNLCYMVCAFTSNVEDEHLLLWRTLSTLLKYSSLPLDTLPYRLWLMLQKDKDQPMPRELVDTLWDRLLQGSKAKPAAVADQLADVQTWLSDNEHGETFPTHLKRAGEDLYDKVNGQALRELQQQIERCLFPVSGSVGRSDDSPRSLDLWGALETPPRPILLYTITVPLDLEIVEEEPLVLTRTIRYTSPGSRYYPPSSGTEQPGRPGMRSPQHTRAMTSGPETTLEAVIARDGTGQATADYLADEYISIGGLIQDSRGNPISGVTVAVAGTAIESAATGPDGRFTVSIRDKEASLHIKDAAGNLLASPTLGIIRSAEYVITIS